MKSNLAWLLSILATAGLALFQRPVPRHPPVAECTSQAFSFYCAGNNHGKAYTGFSTSSVPFPEYSAESSTLDHP